MFQVNRVEKCLVKLEEKRFSDLELEERKHLQEWLASTPDALGEEFLIIQKEFDGFEDTRERLDLLALDKKGQLVIIENKLDDSGRDTVWQVIKYAAYCSSLNKAQIVSIYQKYLDMWCGGGEADKKICEFLGEDALDEVILNAGNSQRVVLIAGHFRKEVTATVLWLLSHNIRAQCYRVIPYNFRSDLFVDLQQIIPTPEAEDFMIGMATKETEEKSAQGAQQRRHQLRFEFWQQALENLRARGLSRYDTISPSKDHWLSCGTGVAGCVYSLIFAKSEARVELSLQRSSKLENKWIFDQLELDKLALEQNFGKRLEWRKMEDNKSSRICFSHAFECYNKEEWPSITEWMGSHISKLEGTFGKSLLQANQKLKAGIGDSAGSEQTASQA